MHACHWGSYDVRQCRAGEQEPNPLQLDWAHVMCGTWHSCKVSVCPGWLHASENA